MSQQILYDVSDINDTLIASANNIGQENQSLYLVKSSTGANDSIDQFDTGEEPKVQKYLRVFE